MTKALRTDEADKVDPSGLNRDMGEELKQINEKLGGYDEMVKILSKHAGFEAINKSTFTYWKNAYAEKKKVGKTLKTKRFAKALEILKSTQGKSTLGIAYNDSLWNLPITLVCWQPPDASKKDGRSPSVPQGEKAAHPFPELKKIGLGRLQERPYSIIARADRVPSGSEALVRLRDDPTCSVAIVASELAVGVDPPSLKLCPISRPLIEGIVREAIKRPSQLQGKPLGFPEGAAVSDVVRKHFLRQGLKPPDFRAMPKDNAATAADLRDGKLFGFVGWQPQLGAIKAAMGSNEKLSLIPPKFFPVCNWMSSSTSRRPDQSPTYGISWRPSGRPQWDSSGRNARDTISSRWRSWSSSPVKTGDPIQNRSRF